MPMAMGAASSHEISAWSEDFVQHLAVTLDGRPLVLDPAMASVTIPHLKEFAIGLQPIEVAFQLPAVARPDIQQSLTVTNHFQELKSTYTYDVSTSNGVGIVTHGWPSKEIRLVYGAGIGTPAMRSETTKAMRSVDRACSKAADLFDRDRTPTFFLVLLFDLRHRRRAPCRSARTRQSPGRGLSGATQGTMRDAVALASIVTTTHTAGVFALGGVTISASAIFLPTKGRPDHAAPFGDCWSCCLD